MPTHGYVGIDKDKMVVLVGADIPDRELAAEVRNVILRGGYVSRVPLERSKLFAAHLYQVAPDDLLETL
jgi:hypothetical protein